LEAGHAVVALEAAHLTGQSVAELVRGRTLRHADEPVGSIHERMPLAGFEVAEGPACDIDMGA
jgi:hypothetical protein